MNINLSEIPTDLILNLLNIVVLYVIVRALVYKPVKRFMQARTDRVTEQNAQAQRLMEQARKRAGTPRRKTASVRRSRCSKRTKAHRKSSHRHRRRATNLWNRRRAARKTIIAA